MNQFSHKVASFNASYTFPANWGFSCIWHTNTHTDLYTHTTIYSYIHAYECVQSVTRCLTLEHIPYFWKICCLFNNSSHFCQYTDMNAVSNVGFCSELSCWRKKLKLKWDGRAQNKQTRCIAIIISYRCSSNDGSYGFCGLFGRNTWILDGYIGILLFHLFAKICQLCVCSA